MIKIMETKNKTTYHYISEKYYLKNAERAA